MELTKIAILVATHIIIESVRKSTVLLDLKNNHSRTDSVNRAGGNKVDVTAFYLLEGQELLYRAIGNSRRKLIGVTLPLKSHIKARALVRLNNVPHLGLAKLSFILKSICIRRMHLHRELILSINKLSEHGKGVELLCRGSPGLSRERLAHLSAVLYPCLTAVCEGELPALGYSILLRLLAIGSELVTAPNVILGIGYKSVYLLHWCLPPWALDSFLLSFYHFSSPESINYVIINIKF